MIAPRLALREIFYRRAYAGLFVVALGFGAATLASQARELSAADIRVEGAPQLLDALKPWALQRWPAARMAETVDTISMARFVPKDRAAQVSLRAASSDYPLYGGVATGSGRPLREVLKPGALVVGPKLLTELDASVGDRLRVGDIDLAIADTIAARTDMSVSFFEFAPAVFIAPEDLRRSGLVVPGSRTRNTLYINPPPAVPLASALAEVKARVGGETSEVESWETDSPGVHRFLRRTMLFMDFLGLLTLTLGGIGVASALSAALAASARSNGMLIALGAPRRALVGLWLWWVLILTAAGLALALVAGVGLARLLAVVYGDLLPANFALGFPVWAFARAGATGLVVSLLFTLMPLSRLRDVPPNAILAHEVPSNALPWRRVALFLLPAAAVFYLLILGQVVKPILSLQYLGGLAAVLGLSWMMVLGLMRGLHGLLVRRPSTVARLAARGLLRPGNLNNAVVVSLSVSLVVILTLFLLQRNLIAQYIQSFPADAPNVFFINIQKHQVDRFREVVGDPKAPLHPLIRGRVMAVNGVSTAELTARSQALQGGSGDGLTREFGFTFGEELLPTDRVSEGGSLWSDAIEGPQVSVYDAYKERFGMRVGDKITVNILGRTLSATVSSMRAIDQSNRQPFYYFYFRPGLIDGAPFTYMGGFHVPKEKIPAIENALAKELPNVTSIDLSDVAALAGRILRRLGRIVNTLGLFGVGSGLLLLVSNLWTTLLSRVRESVLYRTLGATEGQVTRIYLMEYAVIGGAGALAALFVGTAAAWALLKFVFKSDFHSYLVLTAPLMALSAVAIAGLSWAASRSALRAAPMEVLRHE